MSQQGLFEVREKSERMSAIIRSPRNYRLFFIVDDLFGFSRLFHDTIKENTGMKMKAEHLPATHKALALIPSTANKTSMPGSGGVHLYSQYSGSKLQADL